MTEQTFLIKHLWTKSWFSIRSCKLIQTSHLLWRWKVNHFLIWISEKQVWNEWMRCDLQEQRISAARNMQQSVLEIVAPIPDNCRLLTRVLIKHCSRKKHYFLLSMKHQPVAMRFIWKWGKHLNKHVYLLLKRRRRFYAFLLVCSSVGPQAQ